MESSNLARTSEDPRSEEERNIWKNIVSQMRYEYGPDIFMRSLAGLEFIQIKDNTVLIQHAPGSDLTFIEKHYSPHILSLWQKELPHIEDITFTNPVVSNASTPHASQNSYQKPSTPEHFQTKTNPHLSFSNFVVGTSNAMACEAAHDISVWNDSAPNPLFIYGNVGLGKTHLMHAITSSLKKNHPSRSAALLSAERFMNLFVEAIRHKDVLPFKNYFRSLDILLIDDIHFLCNKPGAQEEFFHTFNEIISNQCRVVVSSIKPPLFLENTDERMRSRLASGLVAQLRPYDAKERLAILRAKMKQQKTPLSDDILQYLAKEIDTNVREMEGAVNHLIAYTKLNPSQNIPIPTLKKVLQDLLRTRNTPISIHDIQKTVAEHFQLKTQDLSSSSRQRHIVIPRHIAMYLAKETTRSSLTDIGHSFGNRDHSTVQHAIHRISKEIKNNNDSVQVAVETIRQQLQNPT